MEFVRLTSSFHSSRRICCLSVEVSLTNWNFVLQLTFFSLPAAGAGETGKNFTYRKKVIDKWRGRAYNTDNNFIRLNH